MSYTTILRPRHFADRRTTGQFHPGTMPPFLPVSIAPSAASIPGSSFGLNGLGWNPAHVLAAAALRRRNATRANKTPQPSFLERLKARREERRAAREAEPPQPTFRERLETRREERRAAREAEPPQPTFREERRAAPPSVPSSPAPSTNTYPTRDEWNRLMSAGSSASAAPGQQPISSITAPASRASVTQAPKKGINKGLLIGGGLVAATVAYFMMQ